MGKVKINKRCRLHLKAGKSTASAQHIDSECQSDSPSLDIGLQVDNNDTDKLVTVPPLPDDIIQRLPVLPLEDQVKKSSDVPNQSRPAIKKKDRRKLRHETWLKKVDVYQKAREEAKALEERKKTVVVGDMQPLINALPELLISTEGLSRKVPVNRMPHRSLVKEVDHFKDVLKHPSYKDDPLGTISQHIQNSIARGLT